MELRCLPHLDQAAEIMVPIRLKSTRGREIREKSIGNYAFFKCYSFEVESAEDAPQIAQHDDIPMTSGADAR